MTKYIYQLALSENTPAPSILAIRDDTQTKIDAFFGAGKILVVVVPSENNEGKTELYEVKTPRSIWEFFKSSK